MWTEYIIYVYYLYIYIRYIRVILSLEETIYILYIFYICSDNIQTTADLWLSLTFQRYMTWHHSNLRRPCSPSLGTLDKPGFWNSGTCFLLSLEERLILVSVCRFWSFNHGKMNVCIPLHTIQFVNSVFTTVLWDIFLWSHQISPPLRDVPLSKFLRKGSPIELRS